MTSTLECAVSGSLDAMSSDQRRMILRREAIDARGIDTRMAVSQQTREIIDRVRTRGDGALREFARRFDKVDIDSLEVPKSEWLRALVASIELRSGAPRPSSAAIGAGSSPSAPAARAPAPYGEAVARARQSRTRS